MPQNSPIVTDRALLEQLNSDNGNGHSNTSPVVTDIALLEQLNGTSKKKDLTTSSKTSGQESPSLDQVGGKENGEQQPDLGSLIGKQVTTGDRDINGVLSKKGDDYFVGDTKILYKSDLNKIVPYDPFANVTTIKEGDGAAIQVPDQAHLLKQVATLKAAQEHPIFQPNTSQVASQEFAKNNPAIVGMAHLRNGNTDEAVNNFDAALQVNPNDAKALVGKGYGAADKGNVDEAINYYQSAANNNDGTGVLLLAGAQLKKATEVNPLTDKVDLKGSIDLLHESLKNIDAVIASNPDDLEAHLIKQKVLRSLGMKDEAAKERELSVNLYFKQNKGGGTQPDFEDLAKSIGTDLSNMAGTAIAHALNPPEFLNGIAQGISEGNAKMTEGANQMDEAAKTGNFKNYLAGTLKQLQGAMNMGMTGAMAIFPESGYTIMQSMSAADEVTNGEASKIIFAPLQTFLPTNSDIGKSLEAFGDAGIGLIEFGIAHKIASGNLEGAKQSKDALNKWEKGENLNGDEIKVLYNDVLQNREQVPKLIEALKKVPDDAPKEVVQQVTPLIAAKTDIETENQQLTAQQQEIETAKQSLDQNFHADEDKKIADLEKEKEANNQKIESLNQDIQGAISDNTPNTKMTEQGNITTDIPTSKEKLIQQSEPSGITFDTETTAPKELPVTPTEQKVIGGEENKVVEEDTPDIILGRQIDELEQRRRTELYHAEQGHTPEQIKKFKELTDRQLELEREAQKQSDEASDTEDTTMKILNANPEYVANEKELLSMDKISPSREEIISKLSPKEQDEIKEYEDLQHKMVAMQGREQGYKPYKLTKKQKERFFELRDKYKDIFFRSDESLRKEKEINDKYDAERKQLETQHQKPPTENAPNLNPEQGIPPKEESIGDVTVNRGEINRPTESGIGGESKLPTDQTLEPPKVEKGTQEAGEATTIDSGGNVVGVSHDRLTALADKLGLPRPERGDFVDPEDQANRGRLLLDSGANPVEIGEQFKKDGLINADRISVARAHLEDLVKERNRLGDAFEKKKTPENKEKFDAANKAVEDWTKNVMKPMGTTWGGAGGSLQGERDLDTGSFTAVKRAREEVTGNPQAELPDAINDLVERVKKIETTTAELQNKLTDALSKKETPTQEKGTKYTTKAKELATKIRSLKGKPLELRDENGNVIVIEQKGISLDPIIEAVAQAVELGGKLTDAILNELDKHEWYTKLTDAGKKAVQKQLEDRMTEDTPEGKNIKRLEKQLENLQQGIIKDISKKRELTLKEKELQEQIIEAKKNLGLIPSKELPKIKEQKNAAQVKLDRLQKELDNLQRGIVKEHSLPIADTPEMVDLKEKILEAKKNLGLIASKKLPTAKVELTREQEIIKRLEKQLEDLEAGKVREVADKFPDTPRIKDLREKIITAKKNLGLIESKELPKIDKTAEQKKLDSLQKQLDDLRKGIVKEKAAKVPDTPAIKKIKEEIINAKKDLGLIESKMPKPEDVPTPEEKHLEQMQNELQRLQDEGKLKSKGEKREPTEDEKALQKQIEVEQDKIKYNNLVKAFADKKDNKFTREESANIWEYAKKNYIDNNPSFKVVDMVNKVAMDLGLTPEQVRHALAPTPETRQISDQIYRNQYEKNKATRTIQRWVNKPNDTPVTKLLTALADPFRGLATLGHGHALLFTHAGANLFDPQIAKHFLIAVGRQFKLVYGDAANYEKAQLDLQNHPLYNKFLKAGLAVDPTTIYDDWQVANTFLKKLHIQGNKGFLVLKMMRMAIAENEYNHLSDIEKADPTVIKALVENANHWTGTAGLKVLPIANAFVFAPNLIASKFLRLTIDPARALYSIGRLSFGQEVSAADRAASKIILKKSGRILATYAGALIANQVLLSLTGSQQNVNFTHPTRSDWLRFKTGDSTGGRNVDVTGGMTSTMQFMTQLGLLPFESQKEVKEDYHGATSAKDATQKEVVGYLHNTLSPFGGTVWDFLSHTDYEGNVLPMYNDKPQGSRRKLSWLDYVEEKLPIPVADAFKTIHDQMIEEGVSKVTAGQIMGGILAGGIASMGVKIGTTAPTKNPFTDQDLKDPVFKYFTDKGFNLPNTSLTSEEITDENAGTKKKISDYPKEKQKEYTAEHNLQLKSELQSIEQNNSVYVKSYKDANGNKVSEVSINPPSGTYETKTLDKLTKEETAQVLSIAQKNATKNAKEKVFPSPSQDTGQGRTQSNRPQNSSSRPTAPIGR